MLIECNNCGAPLDVVSGARQVRCGYCRMTSPVRRMRTLSVQAPADWQPPKVWTPPAQAPQPSVALHYTATTVQGTSGAGVGLVVGLAAVVVVGMAVGVFLLSAQGGSGTVSGARPPKLAEEPAKKTSKVGKRSADQQAVSSKATATAVTQARPASTPVSKSWPKPKSTPTPTQKPPPPPKPKPNPGAKCGCAPSDLMCQMQCAQK
ncbi:MAG: hypothetical protein JRI68_17860 [Deltaproteobacteria bacterium]|nr:hypothetical protein [Deltaproteobacteria bacterium]